MNAFRLYHVFFALAVVTAYLTAEELGLVHAWTGYVVAVAFLIRGLAGLVGRAGFRFNRLLPWRAPVLGPKGLGRPAITHALTLALFACALGAVGTGIAVDQGGTLVGKSIRLDDEHGDEDGKVTGTPFLGLVGTAHADDEEEGEGKRDEDMLQEVHETFGSLLLPLALLHILYMLLFRTDLSRFMLFLGRRRRPAT